MRELVERLLELQELELVREESRIVHLGAADGKLGTVVRRIEALRHCVPDADLRRFDGLRRTGTGAAREENGVCRGCQLAVPVGDLNRMRRMEVRWVCPYCGRFLLVSDSV